MISMWLLGCSGADLDVPTDTVESAPFEHTLSIPGELKAVRSVTINAPDFSGSMEIVTLIEEGTQVEEGGVLVAFDTSDLEKRLENALASLEVSRTKITEKKVQLAVRM